MKHVVSVRFLGLLVWLLLLLGHPALADHLLGGEMSCRYLDSSGPSAAPLRYELTLTVYNNCAATTPPPQLPFTSAEVAIYDQATGNRLTLTTTNYPSLQAGNLNILNPTISNCITATVPPGCTITGPSQPYKLQRFTAIVNLPATTQGFYAVYAQASRNQDITNLDNPAGNKSLTLYTHLAPPAIPNRSPVFANVAVAVICASDTTFYLSNATDPDGDRLEYSFGQPYGGSLPTTFPSAAALTVVPYAAGTYSATAPFGTGAGIVSQLNASSGIATLATPNQGKYVVAVDVKEYRTIGGVDQLIGTTRRDVQLVVAVCPATPAPRLPAAAGLPRSYTIPAGSTQTIPLTASQATGHPLTLTATSELLDGAGGYNAALNGNPGTPSGSLGVATATGTGTVAGTFTYTAGCAEVRPAPYDVAVAVTDEGCAGRTIYELFRITVVNPTGPVAIAGDAAVCGTAATPSLYTASGGNATGVVWSVTNGTIVGSNTVNPVQVRWTGTGTGTLTAQGTVGVCVAGSVSKTVAISTPPTLAVAGSRTLCAGSSTSLTVSGAATGSTYTVAGGPATGTGPTFVLAPTQTTTYTFASNAPAGGCAASTQVIITVNPAVMALAGANATTTSGTPVAIGSVPVAGLTYSWSPAPGLSSPTAANPTVTLTNTANTPITQTYTLTATSTATGCSGTASVVVTVAPDLAFEFPNVITPNGDNLNDWLKIKSVRTFTGNTMEIYNRWGRQVFATTNYDNATNYWGNDPSITAGTYYYLFRQADGTLTRGWVEVLK